MKKLFLYNEQNCESFFYDELLTEINQTKSFFDFYLYPSIKNYFVNFLTALLSGSNFTIIDNNLSQNEIQKLEIENEINKIINCEKKIFNSIDEMIIAIKQSNSRIFLYTSGTTGLPKKNIHTVESLTRMLKESENFRNNIWGFAYSPSHIAGIQVFLQAFLNTNTIINLFNFAGKDIFRLIDEYQITHISATPTFFRLLFSENTIANNIKRITLGGEKSDAVLWENLKKKFPNTKIRNIYAATEFGSILISDGEYFSIPKLLADFVKIEENEILINSELLNLEISGENNFTIKNVNEKNEIADSQKVWFKTGDIIEFLEGDKTKFKIISRKNDFVNIGGYRVNLLEIEETILTINSILNVRVASKKNSVLGNILTAEVQLKDNCVISEIEIKKELRTKLAYYKIPSVINIVNEIKTTSTGKIARV